MFKFITYRLWEHCPISFPRSSQFWFDTKQQTDALSSFGLRWCLADDQNCRSNQLVLFWVGLSNLSGRETLAIQPICTEVTANQKSTKNRPKIPNIPLNELMLDATFTIISSAALHVRERSYVQCNNQCRLLSMRMIHSQCCRNYWIHIY